MLQQTRPAFLTLDDLRGRGLRRGDIETAVSNRSLLRVRNGRYVRADTHPDIVSAARYGGRLDCVSLLAWAGVFVLTPLGLHVQVSHGASRLPTPPRGVRRHWRRTSAHRSDLTADIVGALAQACRCQDARSAIATLDSAWNLGLVDEEGLGEVFSLLPSRFRAMRSLLDRRSGSGSESLMRLILRSIDCDVQLQVHIVGVGRVDFVVDGWLVIECDSRSHHDGWDAHRRDRRRDLAAAQLGYTTIRPLAEDIFHHRDQIRSALVDILAAGGASPQRLRKIDRIRPSA